MHAPRPPLNSTRPRLALAWLLGCLLAGCAGTFQPQPAPEAEPPGARYVDLTLPFIAMGDTQEHESTGYPMLDNDSAVDAYVEVAQRPPEQPLFGRRVLDWVLQRHRDEPFIHLGDVMDLSCRSEAERMARIFMAAGSPGAILPGNHDGLMFGIYGYRILDAALDRDARRWNQACRRGAAPEDKRHKTGSEALSKRDFIAMYLGHYARLPRLAAGLQPPPPQGEHRVSWRNPDGKAFLSAIEARLLDGYAYADSFLAQRLRLPPAPGAARGVILIGLDTNQAGLLASTWDTVMGRSPGSMGHVHADQIAAVRGWVLEAARNGDIVVFAGHHNWRSLGLASRIQIRNLMSNVAHPLVYLSAHTHRGFWAVHRELDSRTLLELNVSSLSDWPIAYRRISFAFDEASSRLLVRGQLMPRSGAPIDGDRALLEAWESAACAPLGPSLPDFRRFDHELVKRQRESRGSLVEWAVAALAPLCESCERPLYQHALAYQDALLDAIAQLAAHLRPDVHRLHEARLPAWCGTAGALDCIRTLQSEQAADAGAEVALFRRKATLVDALSAHLDTLQSPEASGYMTCRAVHAARIDFELTDDSRNNDRGEAKRLAEHFFRVEASVGLD